MSQVREYGNAVLCRYNGGEVSIWDWEAITSVLEDGARRVEAAIAKTEPGFRFQTLSFQREFPQLVPLPEGAVVLSWRATA